jgi:radical SAM superfamily enzyme YgiQ (UPF0313 family)
MKLIIIHLYRHFEYSNMVYPIVLDVLKTWAGSIGWDAQVIVARENEVDLSSAADVVAISTYTQCAPAAYRLASALRARGRFVVLGGPHFRGSTWREAIGRCDAVASSICEEQWQELLSCVAARKQRASAAHATIHIKDDTGQFRYPDNILPSYKDHRWYHIPSVPTSLGCPFDCDFCSAYLPGRYLLRPLDSVCREVAYAPGNRVFLCDATFGLNKKFTIELMDAIAPLKKQILIETTLTRLADREILNALARGGVKWISVGIESLSLRMAKHGKTNLEVALRDVIEAAHDHGMLIQGNFICGQDCDKLESFDRIYDFYGNTHLDLVILDLLVPYPNTALYEEFRTAGRIVDANWEHYDYRHVVYQPKNMSRKQLVDGFISLYRRVTSGGFVANKAYQIFKNHGFNIESSALVLFNLFARFDAARKRRILHLDFDSDDIHNVFAPAQTSDLDNDQVSEPSPRKLRVLSGL